MAPKYARKALADALRAADIDDQVLAVGLFAPRGSTVGILAGGFVGDVVGGGLGGALGSALGELGAVAGGRTVAGDIHKLPSDLILGVCEEWVYGATLPGLPLAAVHAALPHPPGRAHRHQARPGLGACPRAAGTR